MNEYSQNEDDSNFANNLFLTISNLSGQYIIAVVAPLRDRPG